MRSPEAATEPDIESLHSGPVTSMSEPHRECQSRGKEEADARSDAPTDGVDCADAKAISVTSLKGSETSANRGLYFVECDVEVLMRIFSMAFKV